MQIERATVAILGALDAFPVRIAAREIDAKGGRYRRSLSRRTDLVVVGHQAIDRTNPERFLYRLEQCRANGAEAISEHRFLELLGLRQPADDARQFTFADVSSKSKLSIGTIEILSLFDVFEHASTPFGFCDLLIAKQCSELITKGAEWPDLVRAIRSSETAITSLRLDWVGWRDVVARHGNIIWELNGQQLLFADHPPEAEIDDLLAEAEEAGQIGDWPQAIAAYEQCIAASPRVGDLHFNLSHALIETKKWSRAKHHLNVVLKLEPDCADAWYNLGVVAKSTGDIASAKRNFQRAIKIDPTYPDPIYNLALINLDDGAHAAASKLFEKYVQLDPDSDWGRKANDALQLIRMMNAAGA